MTENTQSCTTTGCCFGFLLISDISKKSSACPAKKARSWLVTGNPRAKLGFSKPMDHVRIQRSSGAQKQPFTSSISGDQQKQHTSSSSFASTKAFFGFTLW